MENPARRAACSYSGLIRGRRVRSAQHSQICGSCAEAVIHGRRKRLRNGSTRSGSSGSRRCHPGLRLRLYWVGGQIFRTAFSPGKQPGSNKARCMAWGKQSGYATFGKKRLWRSPWRSGDLLPATKRRRVPWRKSSNGAGKCYLLRRDPKITTQTGDQID
jgi:hypothetical protein